MVEETKNLLSYLVSPGVLNLEREYCTYVEGIASNPHVASILSKDEMYKPWETCGIAEDGRWSLSQFYEAMTTWWFKRG